MWFNIIYLAVSCVNPLSQQTFNSGDNSAGGGTDQPTGFEPDTPRDRKQKPVLMVSPLKTRPSEQGRHGIQHCSLGDYVLF